jgi:hypothetical protein
MGTVILDTLNPPLYKQVLVGLLVGSMLGPVSGWFIGTFATFFTTALIQTGTRGMRTSAFVGGLFGIPFGFVTGVLVATPVRVVGSFFHDTQARLWAAAIVGGLLGFGSANLIHQFWNPSEVSLVYLGIHSVVVGGVTASVASIAKPKWI